MQRCSEFCCDDEGNYITRSDLYIFVSFINCTDVLQVRAVCLLGNAASHDLVNCSSAVVLPISGGSDMLHLVQELS